MDLNLKKLTTEFWENGYLVLNDFFEPKLMNHLNSLIIDHFGMNPDFSHTDEFVTKSKVEVIPWFPQREGISEFNAIDEYPGFNDLTKAILGSGWQSQYSMVMFSKKGSRGQAWHQDCPPDDSTKFNLNRLVYTMDIDETLGGQTVVMPGTHKMGILPIGNPEADIDGQVVLSPKKGTLVLLHGHTWHRVLPVKGTYRVSTNYRSAPQGTPDDITDICVYRNMKYRFSTSELVEERV